MKSEHRLPLWVVRPASRTDVHWMAEHFPDRGAAQKHGERLARQLSGAVVYLVAVYEEQPIGHALLNWAGASDDQVAAQLNAPCSDIEDLFVLGEHRGQGVGSCLLRHVEALARARQHRQIGLSVATDNHTARRLYERLGFRAAGIGPHLARGDYVDANGQQQVWEEFCIYLIKTLD